MKIEKTHFLQEVNRSIKNNPVTALIGSRQSGKTTLARVSFLFFKFILFFINNELIP